MEYNAIYDPLSTVEMRRRMIHSHNDPCCHDPQKSHFCGKGVIAKRGELLFTGAEQSGADYDAVKRRRAQGGCLALRADERRDKLR